MTNNIIKTFCSVTSLPVELAVSKDGKQTRVSCVLKDDLYALVDKNADLGDLRYKHYFHNASLDAPVDAGTIVGGVDVYYNGEIIATGVLITEDNIEANSVLLFLDNAREFVTGRVLWLTVAFFIVIFSLVHFLSKIRSKHRSAKKMGYTKFL